MAVVGRHNLLAGAVFYDVACGTGSALLYARERAQATGVDLTVELNLDP